MPVDVAEPMTKKEQVAETRELLRTHFRKAKEAHNIAIQHDEMVQKLALELAAMEAEAKSMSKNVEVLDGKEADNNGAVGCDTPSFVNRGLLFTHESRDVDLEFQKLSLDLTPNTSPIKTSFDTFESLQTSHQISPNSKYLLTPEDENCLSFFEGILREGPEDTGSARSSLVSSSNGRAVFHSASPDHVWPDLCGSPEVFLHIYNVAEFSEGLQSLLSSFGTGAYHVGVEVYGKEWSYCQDPLPGSGTGIDMLRVPKNHPTHQYEETVSLGATSLTPVAVKCLMQELAPEWQAVDYNALRRNCVTFAEKFCDRLGVNAPPPRVGSLTKGLKMFLFA